jgi:hypothetical protein
MMTQRVEAHIYAFGFNSFVHSFIHSIIPVLYKYLYTLFCNIKV